MWVEIFKKSIALFFIGIVIKLLDDEVDRDSGIEGKYRINLINEINQYSFPYALLLLALAMLLEGHYSFSLFTSAYMIGMFNFFKRTLPTKMKAYQETMILIIINLILIPHRIFMNSFLVILLIQVLDDLIDADYDLKYGYFNLANKYGKGEMLIFSIILITISFMLSFLNTTLILLNWICINYLYLER